MREILFRGKRADTGEWIEGYYCRAFRWTGDKNPTPVIQEADCYSFREIIPETVGQYTGLTDKNGNRVFEGDIVKLRRRRDYGIVKYAIPECHFEYLMQGDGDQLLFDDVDYVEIIGNIHDNADLLGGENNAKEQ